MEEEEEDDDQRVRRQRAAKIDIKIESLLPTYARSLLRSSSSSLFNPNVCFHLDDDASSRCLCTSTLRSLYIYGPARPHQPLPPPNCTPRVFLLVAVQQSPHLCRSSFPAYMSEAGKWMRTQVSRQLQPWMDLVGALGLTLQVTMDRGRILILVFVGRRQW